MRCAPKGHQGLIALVAAGLGGALAGCGGTTSPPPGGGGTGGTGGGPAGAAITYYRDVLPIVNQHCVSCHSADGIAPFAMTSYADTRGYAAFMAAATQAGRMPPWMPAPGCGDFTGVRRLTPAEIATLQGWNDLGAPEGNPADAPAPRRPDAGGLPPSAVLDPGANYQPNMALTDDYRCFLVDPVLVGSQDLVGFNIHPGTPASVHHVLLFAVPPARLAEARAKDDAEAGLGWTCFAGTGVASTPTIGGWVPGSGAATFPAPTGIRLVAGTQVIMQIHYNLLVDKDVSDRTTADLYYAPQPVTRPALITALANTTFVVGAGVASQTVSAELRVSAPAALWGVVPHMHLHGTEIKVEIRRADGSATCAIDIPRWDFHWQQFYYYQAPIAVAAGDTVHLDCTFDNSAERQPIIDGIKQPPADLRWGERTTDEMCLNYLYVTGP